MSIFGHFFRTESSKISNKEHWDICRPGQKASLFLDPALHRDKTVFS